MDYINKNIPSIADRVLIVTTSDFGRNFRSAIDGSDHGTASAHFLIGNQVKGGIYGEYPSFQTSTLDSLWANPSADRLSQSNWPYRLNG